MEHYRNATGTLQSASIQEKHSWHSIFQKDVCREVKKRGYLRPEITEQKNVHHA